MPHRNAPLAELGRLRLARCVVEDGWPLRRAAELGISRQCGHRWVRRLRIEGWDGPHGRRSGPRCLRRTPAKSEQQMPAARGQLWSAPDHIARATGVPASTLTRVPGAEARRVRARLARRGPRFASPHQR
ncbi:leucine zipper domain-containing protein [Nonomuraea aridisoli]|uniref:leucine zipper domain-containing protein n=1 Tax=Nonomuraea aridisoli TaxID=2070368 RepID=UPI0015E8D834|nr:leucine zipper domain-containing protein [Nonomuraea aridisoli]